MSTYDSMNIMASFVAQEKTLSMTVGLRVESLNDQFGKHIQKDTLFNNLYDYYARFHDPKKSTFGGIHSYYGNQK